MNRKSRVEKTRPFVEVRSLAGKVDLLGRSRRGAAKMNKETSARKNTERKMKKRSWRNRELKANSLWLPAVSLVPGARRINICFMKINSLFFPFFIQILFEKKIWRLFKAFRVKYKVEAIIFFSLSNCMYIHTYVHWTISSRTFFVSFRHASRLLIKTLLKGDIKFYQSYFIYTQYILYLISSQSLLTPITSKNTFPCILHTLQADLYFRT